MYLSFQKIFQNEMNLFTKEIDLYVVDKTVKYTNMYINYKKKHVQRTDKARLYAK